jgi:hypothetical protein
MKHVPSHRFVARTILLALAACAAPSSQFVPLPSQDVEVSSSAVSRIYVMRLPQVKGAFRDLRVKENEREIGSLGGQSFVCWERPPGRSLVVVTYEGTAFSKDDRESMIDVQAEAGQAYYYGITVDDAWNKAVVQLLDRDEGRKVLQELGAAKTH